MFMASQRGPMPGASATALREINRKLDLILAELRELNRRPEPRR
jgi:hypothetical protein